MHSLHLYYAFTSSSYLSLVQFPHGGVNGRGLHDDDHHRDCGHDAHVILHHYGYGAPPLIIVIIHLNLLNFLSIPSSFLNL
jgi:hypothetical protein